ncbi:MAG: hypothetical protein BWY75_01828 [bacterium ADurb.Bin425]|nr:MAG: hypothetical protein BWY75_01828 [bacterium ADurb.Bin425]
MRLVEAVFGELHHHVEELVGNGFIYGILGTATDEEFTLLLHLFGLFLTHGAAQEVGLSKAVAAQDLGNLHNLLLIDYLSIGIFQDTFQKRRQISNLGLAVLTIDKLIDHTGIKRTRSIKSDKR